VSRRLAHEANAGEVTWLALDLLILLLAGGVVAREVKVTKGSTHFGHHLLELLLLITEAVLLIVILAVVVPLGVVILVGGVELLPLRAVAMKWMVSLHSKQPLQQEAYQEEQQPRAHARQVDVEPKAAQVRDELARGY
jgi:hypothetical protein